MKQLVLVLEDTNALNNLIRDRLPVEKGDIMQFKWPWELLAWLDGRNDTASTEFIIIADLYSLEYWDQSNKLPCVGIVKPSRREWDTVEAIRDGALDCICNYLKDLVDKYKSYLIVYSHVPTFLRRRHHEDWAERIENSLKAVAPNAQIVHKANLKNCQDDEINDIIELVNRALHNGVPASGVAKTTDRSLLDRDRS